MSPATEHPDYVVLRHGPDVPDEYHSDRHEGLWLDRRDVPVGPTLPSPGAATAVAEPTGRLETRADGAVAEVWEIRLTTPNEQRAAAAPSVCPECEQGKHGNCDGTAWDHRADLPTECGCEHRP